MANPLRSWCHEVCFTECPLLVLLSGASTVMSYGETSTISTEVTALSLQHREMLLPEGVLSYAVSISRIQHQQLLLWERFNTFRQYQLDGSAPELNLFLS